MKRCTKCKEEKELTEFNKSKAGKDGFLPSCRACNKVLQRKHYTLNTQQYKDKYKNYSQSKKDGLYTVYLIIKDRYVGSTLNLPFRKNQHKWQGYDNTEYQIIGKYQIHEEALLEEDSWHQRGYEGGLSKQERNKLNNYLQCQNTQTNKN